MRAFEILLCLIILYVACSQAQSPSFKLEYYNTTTFPEADAELNKRLKEKCEATSNGHTYFDEELQRCVLKLSREMIPDPEDYMENGNWSCPENAWSYSENKSTICGCYLKGYIDSLDMKHCLKTKIHEESCDVREDELATEFPEAYGSNCEIMVGLGCRNGVCLCNNAEAVWNSEDKQCYSTKDCERLSYYSFYEPLAKRCFYKLEVYNFGDGADDPVKCPPKSARTPQPNASGYREKVYTCKCIYGYTATDDRRQCEIAKKPGDECKNEDNNSCNSKAGLSCENGKCQCTEEHEWDEREFDCRIPTSSKCDGRGKRSCGRHAICEKYSPSQYSSSYCNCKTGYAKKNSFCYGNHQTECLVYGDCHSQFACMDNKCQCKDPMNQVYVKDTCVVRADSPCEIGLDNAPCTRFATCLNNTCSCASNSTPTSNGKCLLDYGSECDSSGTCNYERGLACINSTCTCAGPKLEYIDGGECVASNEGAVCGKVVAVGKCGFRNCDNRMDPDDFKYSVGCKTPLVCSEDDGVISRCLTPPA